MNDWEPSAPRQNYSLDSLASIYIDDLRRTVITTRDGHTKKSFEDQLFPELLLIRDRLVRGKYRFTTYQEKLILKGADSLPRRISIPCTRDRIALKALQYELAEFFPLAKSELAQSKIRSLRAELKSGKYDYFVRFDIENFFPSISHDFIRNQLSSQNFPVRSLRTVVAAIENPTLPKHKPNEGASNNTGIPQGICIASQLAEICMIPTDKAIREVPNIYFDRFVDDAVILCQRTDLDFLKKKYPDLLRPIGLKVHPFGTDSKSNFGPTITGFEYLGYSITARNTKEPLVQAKTDNLLKFERRIIKLFTQYEYERNIPGSHAYFGLKWRLKLVTNGCLYDNEKRGWLHYFSQMTTASQAHRLDGLVGKFEKKFNLLTIRENSFRDMYWNIRNRNTRGNRICDFDNLNRIEKEEILHKVFRRKSGLLSSMDNDSIDRLFHKVLGREVAQLETDIGPIS